MKPFLTLHHPGKAMVYYDAGHWTSDTCYSLIERWAAKRPGSIALRDGRKSVTWRELRDWVDGVAAHFEGLGLSGGARVSIWMSNRIEAVVTFLAASRIGLACNPSLHRSYTCAEIGTLMARLDTQILVTEAGWGADRDTADLDAVVADTQSVKAVIDADAFPGAGGKPVRPVSDPDSVVYLAFTSGTTGVPKCVMHSTNTLFANARDLARDWSLSSDARLLSLSPLSHHIAWVAVGQWLSSGCQLITDDPPAGTSRLDWIVDTGATYVMGVPTHAMDVLGALDAAGHEKLGSVEVFYMAGSPIPPVVAERFMSLGIKPQNIYGMTENSSHQYTHPSDDPVTWTTSCGRGGKAYEVAIFDPEDRDRRLGVGETGEIGGRGAALMLGYFDNQAATESSFNRDGWFLSGDLGELDEAGNLRIKGRLKELIIRGGHNIHPGHIEALALRHDRVLKAAAFPVDDDRLGEKVCLAVIGDVSGDEVLQHLASEGLSKFDMPEWFATVSHFPLTPSGKILKRELVEMVRRGELKPDPIRYTDKEKT
ncbi:class I adenylate-forming enzyme family protein [Hwanghaeella sp.]|uniref:class I adenylate-forming enzyme family protein n=1 Tax=Hwanghaeella sp. TaxID=2605943 RepID=UPI003CCB9139